MIRCHAVTLTFDLLTLNFYSTSGVKLKAFPTNVGRPNDVLQFLVHQMRITNTDAFYRSLEVKLENNKYVLQRAAGATTACLASYCIHSWTDYTVQSRELSCNKPTFQRSEGYI